MFPVLISVITLLFVPLRNLKIAVMLHTKYYTGKESSSLLLLVFHQTEFFKLSDTWILLYAKVYYF